MCTYEDRYEPCHHTSALTRFRIKRTWPQAEELKKHALEERGNEVPEAQGTCVGRAWFSHCLLGALSSVLSSTVRMRGKVLNLVR